MKIRAILSLFVFMLWICWAFPGCKKSTNPEENCASFTGITERDEVGNIIGNTDDDDWKDSGILHDVMAYPNPYNPVTRVVFVLDSLADIKITVNNGPNEVIRTLVDQTLGQSHWYSVQWDSKNDAGDEVADCIYRVYITATTENNTYQTYGDIELNRNP